MTVSIRIQGASFTKFGDIDPSAAPFIEDARAFYLLGGSSVESLKNRVAGSAYPVATEIGAPSYGRGYARLTCAETNGISAGFNFASQIHTHVVVAARQSTTNRLFAGYWQQTGTHTEASLGMNASFNSLSLFMDAGDRAAVAFNPVVGQFAFHATSYDGVTAKAYAHNGTSLLSASAPYTAAGIDTGAPFLIGASGVGAGEFDASAVITFNRALSAVELGELYSYLKESMNIRGINVL